jgi:ribose transport system permease protein
MTQTRTDQSQPTPSEERPTASIPLWPRVKSIIGFHRMSGAYLLLLIVIAFGIWIPDLFLTGATFHSILSSQAIVAILALGALAPLSIGAIDLSIGANANLAAVIVVVLQNNHQWSMWGAIAFTLLVAVTIGTLNGILVVRFGLSSIIASLAMMSIITATQAIIVGQTQPYPVQDPAFGKLAQREIFGFQSVVIYAVILAFIVWWLLEYTPVGRYLRAVGANAEAAKLAGVNVGRWTFVAFCIAGLFGGIAGILFSSQIGPSLTFGFPLLVPALTACFLGFTQILPGRFNVWGTMLAIIVLATGVKGFQLATGEVWIPDMFNGIALIVAVGFGVSQQKRTLEARRKRAAGQDPGGSFADPGDPSDTEPGGGLSPNPVNP